MAFYTRKTTGIRVKSSGVFLGVATELDFTGAGQVGSIAGTIVTEDFSGGISNIYTETPVGAIDGVNKVYTVLHSITTIISFGINNALIQPTGQYAYTVSGNTITFTSPLDASFAGTPFTLVYA